MPRKKRYKHDTLEIRGPSRTERRAEEQNTLGGLINSEVRAAQREIDQHNHRRTHGLKLIKYGRGATRTAGTPRFGLVPPEGPRLTAIRFTVGAETHGADNWKLDMPIEVIFDHLESHINDLKASRFDEDDIYGHLGAIGWAQAALAWYVTHHPEDVEAYLYSVTHAPPAQEDAAP